MKAFRAIGTFRIDKRTKQRFKLEVAAEDEGRAREKVLSMLGSRHHLTRREITIEEILEISGDEITDLVVKYMVEEKA